MLNKVPLIKDDTEHNLSIRMTEQMDLLKRLFNIIN